MKAPARNRVFYGYVVVAASVLILVVMHGTSASFGVFFSPLQTQFGWSRATISGATSLNFLLLGLFSTFAGRITDRYGPRFTLAAASIALCVGYLLLSRVQSAWQLYATYGIVVALGNSGGDMALLPTVARWFVRRRTLMSSVVKAGTGTGMFVIPLLAAWLIGTFDWRAAYAVLAVLVALVVFSISRLLKRDPSEIGEHAFGEDEDSASGKAAERPNLTFREVVHTPQFWVLCGAYFLVWYATQSAMIHIAPHGVDTGLSVSQSAGVVSAIGGVSIAGRLTMGVAGDRIGTRRAVIVCFAVLLAALSWLQFADAPWMLYVFAPLYGFAHGGFFAIISPLLADLFGTRSHASNLGMLFFIGMTGGAVGPIITGRLYDTSGTYHTAFLIILAAAFAGMILALFLRPVNKPRK